MDDEKIHACQKLMNKHGLSLNEALTVIEEEKELEEVLLEQAIREKSYELEKKPKTEWPLLPIVWDLAPERWHLSMDNQDLESFQHTFRDAEVVWVKTTQLLHKLAERWQRKEDPFSVNYVSKTARLVTHLQACGKISPPMIVYSYESGDLHVAGGNHRLGWAKHISQEKLPILICANERSSIASLLQLEPECCMLDQGIF